MKITNLLQEGNKAVSTLPLSEYFLRSYVPTDHHKGMENNGVMKHLERFRKVIRLGVKLGWIVKNPFKLFKLKMQKGRKRLFDK